jgi:hypothetical protein
VPSTIGLESSQMPRFESFAQGGYGNIRPSRLIRIHNGESMFRSCRLRERESISSAITPILVLVDGHKRTKVGLVPNRTCRPHRSAREALYQRELELRPSNASRRLRVTKAGSTSEDEGMSGIHRTWIDSWDKTKKSILNGEVTEEQAAKLVYQRKFRNTLSKKRQRNKAHVSGPKDDSNEQVVFETTLVAEKGQTKDDLSPLARRIADGVFEMVKQKGYQPMEIWEQTADCVYITLRLRSLRPIA